MRHIGIISLHDSIIQTALLAGKTLKSNSSCFIMYVHPKTNEALYNKGKQYSDYLEQYFMVKVALIKPSPTYRYHDKRPVLGICYISACLKSSGIDCKIFDAHFHPWPQKETVDRVLEYNPDIIGFTAKTHEIIAAASIGSRLKEKLKVPIIVGGCHVTALPERTLREFSAFDYGVRGEGERTIIQLTEFLQNNVKGKPSDIPGLVFRDSDGNVCITAPRDSLASAELDALPYPDFTDYYHESQALQGRDQYYPMITSRGCPYSCTFCMQVLGRRIRRRSAENIIGEVEHAISKYGAHTIDFCDDIFLFNNRETRQLLQLMINESLSRRIRWSGLIRANMVTSELIDLAKRAGCFRIGMGVESGDNEILKTSGKGITVEQVRNAVKIIKQSGILVESYFILGHPNETRETIKKTINLATELNTHTIAVGLMIPYPGTKVYEMAKKGEGGYRLLTENWSEYDKYGGEVLEIEGLTSKELGKWQRRAFLYFYVKNFRLLDMIIFFIKYRGISLIFNKLLRHVTKKPLYFSRTPPQ